MNDTSPLAALLARVKKKKELDEAFKSTQDIEQRMEIFTKIRTFASSFNQHNDLARYSLTDLAQYAMPVTQKLLMLPPQKPQQVFSFGKAALSVFVPNITCFGSLPPNTPTVYNNPRIPPNAHIVNNNPRISTHLSLNPNTPIVNNNPRIRNLPPKTPIVNNNNNPCVSSHRSSMYFACVYYLLGSACLGLERYEESLDFLGWADSKLHNLVKINDCCSRNCVWNLLAATHQQVYNLWVAMGKRKEASNHARKALNFKKLKLNNKDCIELGDAYFEAYKAFVDVRNIKEATSLCLKALEIYSRVHGPFSRKVVQLRVDLAVLYHIRKEYDKANKENQLWQTVLVASSSEYLNAEVTSAKMLIHFGWCEKAIEVMRVVASRTDTERGGQVTSFVKMAKASCILGRYNIAENYLGEAKRLEEKDVDPILFGNVFVDMSILYEKRMKDFDTAVSLLKRVLEMAEYYFKVLPEGTEKLSHQKLFALSSARLFSLYGKLFLLFSLAGWEKEEMLLFMMGVMKKLEEIFGLEHIEVGYGYARLGVTLMKSGKASLAVTYFENAISIMDVSLGPHHMVTLRTSHTLYKIYVEQRRFYEATEIEAKIIEGSKGLGPSEEQIVEKPLDYMNLMKDTVT